MVLLFKKRALLTLWVASIFSVLFSSLVSGVYASVSIVEDDTLSDSIVSYWELDEESGIRYDSHGANNLNDTNSVGFGVGKVGTAAVFDRGNSEYLSISDLLQSNLDITGSISMSLWINLEDISGPQIFVHKYHGNNSKRAYTFYWHNNLLTACLSEVGSVGNCKTRSFAFEQDTWYHVAFSWDSSTDVGRMYVNGLQLGSDIAYDISSIATNSEPLYIGTNEYMQTFDGTIDEVGIWSRALSAAEVDELYNAGVGIPYIVVEESSYPLYTQIISSYPSIEETTEWADDEYAGGSAADSCGETIAECGCAITSLVMSARNAGIEEDILDGDVNPGNMNTYLESVSGYTSYGALRWLAAQAYFGRFTSGGTIATRFGAPSRPLTEVDTMAHIDVALAEGDTAVLGYKNGHFVWVPEKTVDSYIVNDPWWFNTKTADDTTAEKVKDYNNIFTDARVLAISDEPIELSGSDIEVHLQGTAELLFKNAAGAVGYTPQGVVIDLEQASYGDTEVISVDGAVGDSNGKHLLVYEAGDVFTIDIVGTGFGEYEMEFFTISETGEVTTFEFSGVTIPGVTTTWSFNLETGAVTEQAITYEQFLSILDIQMEGYSEQQKKFFLKWAEKMFSDMEEKTISQALQSIETFGKLMGAKKIESPVLVSVLHLLEGSL